MTKHTPEAVERGLENLKARLDSCQAFPCVYTFKFIVPLHSSQAMRELLSGFPFSARQSSGGKYLSYTAELSMETSDHVISVYRAALAVPGCIAL